MIKRVLQTPIPKMDGHNYKELARTITLVLDAKRKSRYLTCKITKLAIESHLHKKWKLKTSTKNGMMTKKNRDVICVPTLCKSCVNSSQTHLFRYLLLIQRIWCKAKCNTSNNMCLKTYYLKC